MKLTRQQIIEIKLLYNQGYTPYQLAKKFNVAHNTIGYWINENYRKLLKDKIKVEQIYESQ